jgi:hypothetical protein
MEKHQIEKHQIEKHQIDKHQIEKHQVRNHQTKIHYNFKNVKYLYEQKVSKIAVNLFNRLTLGQHMTKVAKHMRVQMSTDKNTDKSILIIFQPKIHKKALDHFRVIRKADFILQNATAYRKL